ncbi:hypothetical protein ABT120_37640 [Nonomuraea angiospora]|uniref:hypothetical protein n=1 Tax=Nonomuraea angiospora TaxID=46172 RepID=UPI00331D933C
MGLAAGPAAVRQDRLRGDGGLPRRTLDGKKLLFTVSLARQGDRSAGVLILDLPDFTPRFIKIHKALVTVGGFEWNQDGTRFLVRHGRLGSTTVRLYDLRAVTGAASSPRPASGSSPPACRWRRPPACGTRRPARP